MSILPAYKGLPKRGFAQIIAFAQKIPILHKNSKTTGEEKVGFYVQNSYF